LLLLSISSFATISARPCAAYDSLAEMRPPAGTPWFFSASDFSRPRDPPSRSRASAGAFSDYEGQIRITRRY
jgi:hypothetical protein